MQHYATQCTYCAGETTDVVCMIMHTVQHSANLCTQCSTMQIYADMHMCAHMCAHEIWAWFDNFVPFGPSYTPPISLGNLPAQAQYPNSP